MMSGTIIQSRVKPELKAQAEAIFEGMGLSMGDAIRIFLQQSVNVGGLPFTPTLRKPAPTETLEAMAEHRMGIGQPFTNMFDLVGDDADDQ